MCLPTDRTHHVNIISCRPCTVVVRQRNLAVSFIKHDSLAVCLATGCRLTSNELLRGSAGWRPRLSSAPCLAASPGMLSPLQTNQPKWRVNSPQSAALSEAGATAVLQRMNESSAQCGLLSQKTVIMRVLWSLVRLKGHSANLPHTVQFTCHKDSA